MNALWWESIGHTGVEDAETGVLASNDVRGNSCRDSLDRSLV